VQAGNVGDVTSHGGAIQGTFKQEVTYPLGPERHIPRNRSVETPGTGIRTGAASRW
jgi:hypothetical protein